VDGPGAYKENAVLTQSRGRIVVMLYEGAIKFLHQAIQAIEDGDHKAKAGFLGRAMDIIWELDNCLDIEAGGEIAQNLRSLYGFMRRHLLDAAIKRDPQRIRDVIACLEDLNEGWKAVTT